MREAGSPYNPQRYQHGDETFEIFSCTFCIAQKIKLLSPKTPSICEAIPNLSPACHDKADSKCMCCNEFGWNPWCRDRIRKWFESDITVTQDCKAIWTKDISEKILVDSLKVIPRLNRQLRHDFSWSHLPLESDSCLFFDILYPLFWDK